MKACACENVGFPRVTHILESLGLGPDFVRVAPDVLALARQRGSAVHDAIEADAYGYLDRAELTPEITPYYLAYRRFIDESGHEAIGSEIEVVHPTWQYIGHLDRVGWLVGKRVILDWKSGEFDERASSLQLAGYRLAWNAAHPTEPVDLTAVLQLRADGSYRVHDVNAALYEHVFLAAVTVYHARKERAA